MNFNSSSSETKRHGIKMTSYFKYELMLTEGQKEKLKRNFKKKMPISLRLSNKQLHGQGDELLLTRTQINKIEKSKSNGMGVTIKISSGQIRKQIGGNLVTMLTSLAPMARAALPQLLKTVGLSALSGAVTGGIEKAIKGEGLFSVPQSKVDKLIKYKNYLTAPQKKQIVQALQTGSGIRRFKLTKKQQEGGFLGPLLASIGIPLIMNALTGKGTGRGMQIGSFNGQGMHVDPFLPSNTRSIYVPKSFLGGNKKKTGNGLLLGKNSPYKGIPIIGALL